MIILFPGSAPGDRTPELSRPISPTEFYKWYYNSGSTTLTNLNPRLNQTVVNETCGSSFECVHDYLIRINVFTSQSTTSGLQNFQQLRATLSTVVI